MLNLQAEEIVTYWFYDRPVRYALYEGEWYAVLEDICKILNLQPKFVNQHVDQMHRINLGMPVGYGEQKDEVVSNHPISTTIRYLTCLTEKGVWKAIGRSRRLEAEKLMDWVYDRMIDLRKSMGMEQYEMLDFMRPDIQKKAEKYIGPFGEESLWFNPDNQLWYFDDLPVPEGLSEDELRNYVWQHRNDDDDQIREFEEQYGYSGRGMA